jgi:Spy/CpxP family protein refolding chaperone
LGVLLTALTSQAQPGGFPGGPFELFKPGQILPAAIQDQLKLTAAQRKQIAELQAEVDAKLAKILTAEQKKALEQTGPGGFGPPGFGPGFGPPGFGPMGGFGGGFARLSLDDVKKKLDATDEEWKVIGPKLQNVITARQALTTDASGANASPMGRGPGGPGVSVLGQAQADLRSVLEDPKHTKAEVEEMVAAVRKARRKMRDELDKAQKDLSLLLTAKQEAVLVSLGYLE